MKALYFRDTGSLANLRVENVEDPRIDAHGGEALVRVRAAAINPSDPKSVLGKISETKPPRVPGRDFAGIVVEGPATWKGKEVFGTGGNLGFGRNGSHAEFVSVPVEALVEKPKQLTFEQAAALGLGYLTAWSAIVTAGRVSPNDIVLVLGATGAVGSAAVKIAKHIGAKRVIGVLRKEADRTRTAGIPSDDWLVLEKEPLPQGLFEVTQGKGADLILDMVGGSSFVSEVELRKLDVKSLSLNEAVQLPKQAHSQVQLGNEEKSNLGDQTLITAGLVRGGWHSRPLRFG